MYMQMYMCICICVYVYVYLLIDNPRLPEDLPNHHPCWLKELDPQHFHFQATIIPGQSDITIHLKNTLLNNKLSKNSQSSGKA